MGSPADYQPITLVSLGFGVTLGRSAIFLEPRVRRALRGVQARGAPGWARVQDGRFGEHSPGVSGTSRHLLWHPLASHSPTVKGKEHHGWPDHRQSHQDQLVQPPGRARLTRGAPPLRDSVPRQRGHGAPRPSVTVASRADGPGPWHLGPGRGTAPPLPSGHLVGSRSGPRQDTCDTGGIRSLPSPRPQAVTQGRVSEHARASWKPSARVGAGPCPALPLSGPDARARSAAHRGRGKRSSLALVPSSCGACYRNPGFPDTPSPSTLPLGGS